MFRMGLHNEVQLLKRQSLNVWGQRGFSIMEVMVGGAILGGVVLAGARMFKDQKLAQRRVETDAALNTFHQSLVKIMHNANNCNATLSAYAGASGGSWAAPTAIKICTNCTSTSFDYTASTPGMTTTTAASTGNWIDNTSTWMIDSMQIGSSETTLATGPSRTGRAVLRITYKLNPNLPGGGGKRVSRDINLNLRFTQSGSLFKECLSGNESSVNNLAYDMCRGMNQITSVGTGVLMQWDDASQSCQRVTGVKDCPAGTYLEGVRSDGSVRCKAFSSGIDPNADLMLQSGCAPPATVKLEIVNGKLKATCQ